MGCLRNSNLPPEFKHRSNLLHDMRIQTHRLSFRRCHLQFALLDNGVPKLLRHATLIRPLRSNRLGPDLKERL